MYAGKIVEEGNAVEVFERPQHPYTVGLLRSLPRHGVRKSQRALATIPGTLPQIGTPLPTCVFVDRCPLADGAVPDGRAARRRRRRRPLDALPPPRPHRRAPGARRRRRAGRRPRAREVAHALERVQDLPPERPRRPGPRQGRPRRSTTARRSASSASPGRASRRWPRRSSASRGPTSGSHIELDDDELERDRRPADRSRPSARSRSSSRTPTRRSTAAGACARSWVAPCRKLTGLQGQGRRRPGRQAGQRPAADPAPPRPQAAASCRAASSSAWRSPGPSPATPASSSPTSPRARSTCRSRPRSSTCCRSSRPRARPATC